MRNTHGSSTRGSGEVWASSSSSSSRHSVYLRGEASTIYPVDCGRLPSTAVEGRELYHSLPLPMLDQVDRGDRQVSSIPSAKFQVDKRQVSGTGVAASSRERCSKATTVARGPFSKSTAAPATILGSAGLSCSIDELLLVATRPD